MFKLSFVYVLILITLSLWRLGWLRVKFLYLLCSAVYTIIILGNDLKVYFKWYNLKQNKIYSLLYFFNFFYHLNTIMRVSRFWHNNEEHLVHTQSIYLLGLTKWVYFETTVRKNMANSLKLYLYLLYSSTMYVCLAKLLVIYKQRRKLYECNFIVHLKVAPGQK